MFSTFIPYFHFGFFTNLILIHSWSLPLACLGSAEQHFLLLPERTGFLRGARQLHFLHGTQCSHLEICMRRAWSEKSVSCSCRQPCHVCSQWPLVGKSSWVPSFMCLPGLPNCSHQSLVYLLISFLCVRTFPYRHYRFLPRTADKNGHF